MEKAIFLLTHLMRGATIGLIVLFRNSLISTHAPHARCDHSLAASLPLSTTFLLTHLMRGATIIGFINDITQKFLLTHLMRGATLASLYYAIAMPFLLTHLMRGATYPVWVSGATAAISTHAPHARCDHISVSSSDRQVHFYSRTSCEVRPLQHRRRSRLHHFYSRTSCEVRLVYLCNFNKCC